MDTSIGLKMYPNTIVSNPLNKVSTKKYLPQAWFQALAIIFVYAIASSMLLYFS
jgi:hypothetical protein